MLVGNNLQDFYLDLEKLNSDDWLNFAQNIYFLLKAELQGSNGFIKKLKNSNSLNNGHLFENFISEIKDKHLSNLDKNINQLATNILDLNKSFSDDLAFNYLNYIRLHVDEDYPSLKKITKYLDYSSNNEVVYNRLCSIISKVFNESLSQANKSNAGKAIQDIVKAILKSSGLVLGTHYRENYRSVNSVEVNFVFPAVGDNEENKVDIALACQMSSNDRVKLATEELNVGNHKFILTGNGLDASNGKLKSISNPILNDLASKKVKIICYKNEIDKEIKRITSSKNTNLQREEFIRKNVICFSQFSIFLSNYFKIYE